MQPTESLACKRRFYSAVGSSSTFLCSISVRPSSKIATVFKAAKALIPRVSARTFRLLVRPEYSSTGSGLGYMKQARSFDRARVSYLKIKDKDKLRMRSNLQRTGIISLLSRVNLLVGGE